MVIVSEIIWDPMMDVFNQDISRGLGKMMRFRNALVKGQVDDDLLTEVCRQLEAHGLKFKQAEAAIIDATLVESTAFA